MNAGFLGQGLPHRSGSGVLSVDRRWLEQEVFSIVGRALRSARGRTERWILHLAREVFQSVLAKAAQVYVRVAKLKEIACEAQTMFLVRAFGGDA